MLSVDLLRLLRLAVRGLPTCGGTGYADCHRPATWVRRFGRTGGDQFACDKCRHNACWGSGRGWREVRWARAVRAIATRKPARA